METDKLWENGLQGKIVFNEDEQSWQLSQKYIDFGIDAHLENLEGEEVLIIIKRIK